VFFDLLLDIYSFLMVLALYIYVVLLLIGRDIVLGGGMLACVYVGRFGVFVCFVLFCVS